MGYSCDTEIFTKNGWKMFYDLSLQDEVAVVDKNSDFMFETPFSITSGFYNGYMYRATTDNVDLFVTDNQSIFVEPNLEGYDNYLPDDIIHQTYNIRTSAMFVNEKDFIPDDYIKGYLDGLYIIWKNKFVNERSGKSLSITVSKRYKERLCNALYGLCLSSEDFDFVVSDYDDDGRYNIQIKRIFVNEIEVFKDWILTKSRGYLQHLFFAFKDFYEEEMYSLLGEEIYNNIDYLATLLGYNLLVDKDDKVKFNNYVATVNFSPLIEDKKVKYNGNVYSVNVSTGLILLRRNGKTFIGSC